MRNFQDTFKTSKRSFISAFWICMTVPLKETRNSYFCVTPKKHRLMFVSLKRLKSTVTKKVILCFNNLGEENF